MSSSHLFEALHPPPFIPGQNFVSLDADDQRDDDQRDLIRILWRVEDIGKTFIDKAPKGETERSKAFSTFCERMSALEEANGKVARGEDMEGREAILLAKDIYHQIDDMIYEVPSRALKQALGKELAFFTSWISETSLSKFKEYIVKTLPPGVLPSVEDRPQHRTEGGLELGRLGRRVGRRYYGGMRRAWGY